MSKDNNNRRKVLPLPKRLPTQVGNGNFPPPPPRPNAPIPLTPLTRNGEVARRRHPFTPVRAPKPLKYENKLTFKEQKFVEAKLNDPNITDADAAILAGYPVDRAEQYGKLLHRMKKIQQALHDFKELLRDELVIDRGRVLQEQARIAFFDPRTLPGFPEGIDAATAAGLSSFEIIDTTQITKAGATFETKKYKYTFWNKNAALADLMKHLGLYKADNEQKPPLFQVNQLDLSGFSREELEVLVKVGVASKDQTEEGELIVLPSPEPFDD